MTDGTADSQSMTFGAVIVAAGRGERAGDADSGPKQYRRIGDRTVLAHAIAPFLAHPDVRAIVVVIHPEDEALFESAVACLGERERLRVAFGDRTRQMSVRRGLEALADARLSHVLIHDGARPFASRMLIDRVIERLQSGAEAVIPGMPVTDTLKQCTLGRRVLKTVPREGLYAAQTPQGFPYPKIMEAHRRAAVAHDDGFTDDASIAEWADMAVHVVEGEAENVKLTHREDIATANEKLKRNGASAPLPDVRTGNGYDVHALVEGEGVTLCGVFIEHDQTLSGHSDADVGYHALTDALLATCGAGDIGDHFPPSDPQWKGAASSIFLRKAVEIVEGRGGRIMNADISLVCEAPRIGPHRQAMREAMARDLAIGIDRCSVKATTNEQIGFVGRREGIAAIATATVVYSGSTS